MIGFSFDQIAQGKTMKLTQLAPVGYEDVAYFQAKARKGVRSGVFTLTVLNNGGGAEKDAKEGKEMKWCYLRTYDVDNAVWKDDGRWVRNEDSVVITTENDVTFTSGQGFWFEVSASAYPSGTAADKYTLVNSGEAVLEARAIPLRSGNTGVAIPLSATVKLTQMAPVGYEDVAYFQAKARKGVRSGVFTVTVLNNGGGAEKDAKEGKEMKWCYLRTYDVDNAVWKNDGRWVRNEDSVVITTENDVTFNPGDGLWVEVSASAYPSGTAADKYTLQFPGIEDED